MGDGPQGIATGFCQNLKNKGYSFPVCQEWGERNKNGEDPPEFESAFVNNQIIKLTVFCWGAVTLASAPWFFTRTIKKPVIPFVFLAVAGAGIAAVIGLPLKANLNHRKNEQDPHNHEAMTQVALSVIVIGCLSVIALSSAGCFWKTHTALKRAVSQTRVRADLTDSGLSKTPAAKNGAAAASDIHRSPLSPDPPPESGIYDADAIGVKMDEEVIPPPPPPPVPEAAKSRKKSYDLDEEVLKALKSVEVELARRYGSAPPKKWSSIIADLQDDFETWLKDIPVKLDSHGYKQEVGLKTALGTMADLVKDKIPVSPMTLNNLSSPLELMWVDVRDILRGRHIDKETRTEILNDTNTYWADKALAWRKKYLSESSKV